MQSSIQCQEITKKQLQMKRKIIFIYVYVPTLIHLHHMCAEAHGRQKVSGSYELPCVVLGIELISSAGAVNSLV